MASETRSRRSLLALLAIGVCGINVVAAIMWRLWPARKVTNHRIPAGSEHKSGVDTTDDGERSIESFDTSLEKLASVEGYMWPIAGQSL